MTSTASIDLGVKVRDTVTGFAGTVTGITRFLTGADRYGVTCLLDGKVVESVFDLDRLETQHQTSESPA